MFQCVFFFWYYHSLLHFYVFGLWYKGAGFSNVRLLVSKLNPGGGNPILRICPAVDPLRPKHPWPPAARTGKQSALFYLQASSVPICGLSQIPVCLIKWLQNRLLSMPKRMTVNWFWHSKQPRFFLRVWILSTRRGSSLLRMLNVNDL